jgi:nitronate monooxygenase
MGVGISRFRLAGSVAKAGGMGTVAAQGLGAASTLVGGERNRVDPHGLEAITAETRAAVELAGGRGVVAVNVMVAVTHYPLLVQAALAGGAQAIVSGAGLPMDLPAIVGNADVALIPIVSSARALKLICRHWKEAHGRAPDAVVLEGPQAGGHLGFRRPEIDNPAFQLDALIPQVVEEARKWGEFPVIAAGGIWDHGDAQRVKALGAGAVQLGTRFITTDECDVDQRFKELLLRTQKEDITLIDSPVGLVGRALRTSLVERLERGEKVPFKCTYQCLSMCVAAKVHYCIADHLVNAARGEPHGLFFVGSNGWRCREILPVPELVQRLAEGEPVSG